MFAYIRGKLILATPGSTIVENGGIGYEILTPINLVHSLSKPGSEITLHTLFVVREQSQCLYGFLQPEDKELFATLIDISGIGPKTALSLVGHLSLHAFNEAVRKKDIKTICGVPGIGKKTAERLLIEMRDKAVLKRATTKSDDHPQGGMIKDAMRTLVNLGYSQSFAEAALKKTLDEFPDESDLASLITKTLQHF